jgi:hypothetical protein
MNACDLLSFAFAEDLTLPALAAEDDRKDLAANLEVPWTPGETDQYFRQRFERALKAFDEYSDVKRFPSGHSGSMEKAEFIIKLLPNGEFKESVVQSFQGFVSHKRERERFFQNRRISN